MNRAAEAAVPEAKTLLVGAVADGRRGREARAQPAATIPLPHSPRQDPAALTDRFRPIVKKHTEQLARAASTTGSPRKSPVSAS